MTGYLENLLGALSLTVMDALDEAAETALGLGGEAAGALVLLDLRPGMTIKRLAERLRLSHPGAVRLVDRLEAAGLVARAQGQDRRSVRLSLTDAGAEAVERLRTARAARLAQATEVLTGADRRALDAILAKLMGQLTRDLTDAYANCRLCDVPACRSRGCPVDEKAYALLGPGSGPAAAIRSQGDR